MARRLYSNTATEATLTASITSAATSFTLNSFSGYPAVPFTATLDRGKADEEVVLVTAVSVSTVTVTRGYDGTVAKAHAAGATFLHTTVARDFDEANSHVNTSLAVHGLAGAVVGTTDVQTLTNKTLTTPTLSEPTITGTATMASATLSGTLSVTGATTLAALTATTGAFSGTVTAAAPTAAGHLVTKTYADALGSEADTASTIVRRSASKVIAAATVSGLVAPTLGDQAANKAYADALGTAAATASTIMRRDASGNTAVNKITAAAAATAANDLLRKGEFDTRVANLPTRIATGNASVSMPAGSTQITAAVPFGVTFTTAPVVLITMTESGNDYMWIAWAQSITTTGFTVRIYSTAAGAPATAPISFNWMAVA